MNIDQQLFQQAQAAFNSIRVIKGQVTTIATCSSQGDPNVAPIGSMRIVDTNTVHVLQGMLPRTMKNLESNPKAAFSVILPATLRSAISMLRSGDDAPIGYRVYAELVGIEDDAPIGYRVYAELVGIEDDKATVRTEVQEILRRVPWLLRGLFARFCDKNLRRLLRFQILEIRAT